MRTHHQRAPDREHLLLAAGELAGLLIAPLGEAREQLEDRGAVALDRGAIRARIGAHREVLGDGQERKYLPPFHHEADAEPCHAIGAQAVDLAAGEDDRALVGIEQASDRLEHRRLACAVRAEHGDDAARLNLKAHAANRQHRTVIGLEIGDLQQRGGGAHDPR